MITKKIRLVTDLIELCHMPFSNTFSFYNGLKVSDEIYMLNIIYSSNPASSTNKTDY